MLLGLHLEIMMICILIVNDQLNAYDVLVADDVIFSEGALRDFIAGPATGKGATAVARESEVGVSA